MKNQITQLEINNFKSIKHVELDCKRINVIIGKPNVGKSNFLEALSLYGAPYSQSYQKYLSDFIRYENPSNLFFDQNRKNAIKISSSIGSAYLRYLSGINQYDIIIDPDGDLYDSLQHRDSTSQLEEKFINYIEENYVHQEGMIPYYEVMNKEGSVQPINNSNEYPVKKYDFKKLEKYNNPYDYFLLPPYGENLFTILERTPGFRKKINPFFDEYGLKLLIDEHEKKLEIVKIIDDILYRIPYSLSADTLQRIIFHLAAIESNQDSILLFEEPEAHSYPPYIRMLAEKIVESAENQFFITTHSPYIFNTIIQEAKIEELAIFHATYEDYQTKFRALSEEEIREISDYGVDVFFNLD